jgi:hypothetical protein
MAQETLLTMRDLSHPRLIWLKGFLFLVIAVCSAVLLWLEHPTLKVALLLGLSVWGFCRAYYFAFYVIEKYVDPHFKFAGLGAFLGYLFRNQRSKAGEPRTKI